MNFKKIVLYVFFVVIISNFFANDINFYASGLVDSSAILNSDSDKENEEFIESCAIKQEAEFEKIYKLVQDCCKFTQFEPTFVKVQAPCIIVGDLHGNSKVTREYVDLCRKKLEKGDINSVVFLGDYVDRGPDSIGVLSEIMSLKIDYVDKVAMLRGNHEFPEMWQDYGFLDEIFIKFPFYFCELKTEFENLFKTLPCAAVIDNKVFCVHGGIPTKDVLNAADMKILEVQKYMIPTRIVSCIDAYIIHLLWNDPNMFSDETLSNSRGVGKLFSKSDLKNFLETFDYQCVVRGHEFVPEGLKDCFGDKKCFTVFSASNYAGENNVGAIAFCNPRHDIIPIYENCLA